MFFHENNLQYDVWVETPDPSFAKALQQAIGGVEGEIRVCLQYLFQAWGARGPERYRDLLLETGTEEMGHIEMLATAVALNLEGASVETKEEMAEDSVVEAVLSGKNPRHILSSGLGAMPVDSNGVTFDCSHVYASGNIAADMHANVTAEATGRSLACRLYNLTDDPGMEDMLSYLIARDTMHQNQWMAALEEMGYEESHPIPNSFPQELENQDVNYSFMSTLADDKSPVQGRWSEGESVDGKGTFKTMRQPGGNVPTLEWAKSWSGAQKEQMQDEAPSASEVMDAASVSK